MVFLKIKYDKLTLFIQKTYGGIYKKFIEI
jgi:hypothetical protein